jgi:hypothetical protein
MTVDVPQPPRQGLAVVWPPWLVPQVWGLCVVVAVLIPRPVLAQLPNCERSSQHSKTDSPDPVNQGNDLTYTITLVPFLTETCFAFEDPIPANTTFQSLVAAGWTCTTPPVGSGGTVSCSKLLFQQEQLTLVVRVDPAFTGTLSNVGTVSMKVAPDCFPPPPTCTVEETTTVDVPVELIGFGVE